MQLTDLVDSAESSAKTANADAWSELEIILQRAGTPHHKDGARALQLGNLVGLCPERIRAAAQLGVIANRISATTQASTAAVSRLADEAKAAEARRDSAEKSIAKAKAERDRILADLPEEVRKLRGLAELVAALAAGDVRGNAATPGFGTTSETRRNYLKSRGWTAQFHPGAVAGAGRTVYTKERGGAGLSAFAALEVEAKEVIAGLGRDVLADGIELAAHAQEQMDEPEPALTT